MRKAHPHAEAAYRVVGLGDGCYGVEVSIEGTHPTTVSRFATEAEAEAWIAEHRRRVEQQSQAGGWFARAGVRRKTNPN